MPKQQYTQFLKRFTIGILPLLIIFTGMPAYSFPMKVSVKFPPIKKRIPATVRGGKKRCPPSDYCLNIQESKAPLTALMPKGTKFAKTTIANPTFYLYIPKNDGNIGYFMLMDENKNSIYEQEFKLTKQSGILKVSIPKTINIKINQKYSWSFSIICDPDYWMKAPYVKGSLQRIKLSQNIKKNLNEATILEKAKMYAKLKIWHETLSTVADLRSQQPKEWEELLISVGLKAICQEPFLN